jgi:hypothetical protein
MTRTGYIWIHAHVCLSESLEMKCITKLILEDFEKFWRWYTALGITGFMDFVTGPRVSPPFTRGRKQIQFPKSFFFFF